MITKVRNRIYVPMLFIGAIVLTACGSGSNGGGSTTNSGGTPAAGGTIGVSVPTLYRHLPAPEQEASSAEGV